VQEVWGVGKRVAVDFSFLHGLSGGSLSEITKPASMERVEETKHRIEELKAEIVEHDRRYYLEAAPSISDQEYDTLYRKLRELEEQFPELVTKEFSAGDPPDSDAKPGQYLFGGRSGGFFPASGAINSG
jgi:hypothetical protein